MKTFAELAEELKLSERQFYRLLNSMDPRATGALKHAIIDIHVDDLREVCTDLQVFADKFERCDPETAKAFSDCATMIYQLIDNFYNPEGDTLEDALKPLAE